MILVTGANGFTGSKLIEILAIRGLKIRAFVENNTSVESIKHYLGNIEVVRGDIRNIEDVKRAVKGCEKIYHLAAICDLSITNKKKFYEVNAIGTKNIVESALDSNVERIVFTSTCSIIGMNQRALGFLGNENDILKRENGTQGDYALSKIRAERIVEDAQEKGLEGIIVYPTCPIGAGEGKTESEKLIRLITNEKLKGYVNFGINFVSVKDCAIGHYQAMEKGKPGERYILSGENMMMKDFIERVSSYAGTKPPKLTIGYKTAISFAYLCKVLSFMTKKSPMVSIEEVKLSKYPFVFTHEKATRELGYEPYQLEKAIREAIEFSAKLK